MSPRRHARLRRHQRERKRWQRVLREWNAMAERGEEIRMQFVSSFDVIYLRPQVRP